MTLERFSQILNNVSEEFTDHGDTSFASKKELCEVIQGCQKVIDDLRSKLHSQKANNLIQALDNFFK